MDLVRALRQAADILEKSGQQDIGLPAYQLKKQLCELPPGTVFLHDAKDRKRGSVSVGCMKLAWHNGNCQIYVANSFILPGQEAGNYEWFERIRNDGSYTPGKDD